MDHVSQLHGERLRPCTFLLVCSICDGSNTLRVLHTDHKGCLVGLRCKRCGTANKTEKKGRLSRLPRQLGCMPNHRRLEAGGEARSHPRQSAA